MALSKQSVQQAKKILKIISPNAAILEIEIYRSYEKKKYEEVGYIYLLDEKADGGFENVFINIEDMNEVQREIWENHKNDVPNSCIDRTTGNVTCIGWF